MQFREISGAMGSYQVPLLAPSRVDDGDSRRRADRRIDRGAGVGACAGQYPRNGNTAARSQPVGHVYQRRSGGEGGPDRACLRLARHLDGMARQDDRDRDLQAAGARGLEHAGRACVRRRKAWNGCETAERSPAVPRRRRHRNELSAGSIETRRHQGAVASRLERIEAVWAPDQLAVRACWRPSARPRHSSACSAPSGAS